MDDVIVIILTLVLTIFAAINQQKKKKKHVPQEEEGEPDFWEEVLLGNKREPKQEKAKEPVMTIPEPVRKTEQMFRKPVGQANRMTSRTNRQSYHEGAAEGGRNDEVLKYATGADAFGSESQTEQTETLLEDFSLKKAVIYSEIIQPKYF